MPRIVVNLNYMNNCLLSGGYPNGYFSDPQDASDYGVLDYNAFRTQCEECAKQYFIDSKFNTPDIWSFSERVKDDPRAMKGYRPTSEGIITSLDGDSNKDAVIVDIGQVPSTPTQSSIADEGQMAYIDAENNGLVQSESVVSDMGIFVGPLAEQAAASNVNSIMIQGEYLRLLDKCIRENCNCAICNCEVQYQTAMTACNILSGEAYWDCSMNATKNRDACLYKCRKACIKKVDAIRLEQGKPIYRSYSSEYLERGLEVPAVIAWYRMPPKVNDGVKMDAYGRYIGWY